MAPPFSTSARHALNYLTLAEPLTRLFAGPALDLVGLSAGDGGSRLLDDAAGTGAVALEAARRGATVVATDFAVGMVDVVRRRAVEETLDVSAQVHDGHHLGFVDGSFDVAVSNFGLIFFADPAAGMAELHRVVRPGGRVAVASWDLAAFRIPHVIRSASARAMPGAPPPPAPPWAPFGVAVGLRDLLLTAGFADVAVHRETRVRSLDDLRSLFRHAPGSPPSAATSPAGPTDARGDDEGLPAHALIAVGRRM